MRQERVTLKVVEKCIITLYIRYNATLYTKGFGMN